MSPITPEALTKHEQQQVDDALNALGVCWSTNDYKGAERVMAGFLREVKSNVQRALAASQETPQAALRAFFRRLVASQVDLPPDCEKILHENLWELYGTEPAAEGPDTL